MNRLYKKFGTDLNIINFQVGAPTKILREKLIQNAIKKLQGNETKDVEVNDEPEPIVDNTITVPEPSNQSVFVENTDVLKLDEDPSAMKKTDLIAYVITKFGPDADTSGTKAEIIARFFNT